MTQTDYKIARIQGKLILLGIKSAFWVAATALTVVLTVFIAHRI